jgi:hypothetical protein
MNSSSGLSAALQAFWSRHSGTIVGIFFGIRCSNIENCTGGALPEVALIFPLQPMIQKRILYSF